MTRPNTKNNPQAYLLINCADSLITSIKPIPTLIEQVNALSHSSLSEIELDHGIDNTSTFKFLLANYIGQTAQSIDIQKTTLGKPYLKNFPHIYFNISHTQGYSCIAMNTIGEIGVDIENERSTLKDQDLPFTALSAHEQAYCIRQDNQRHAFFRIWTAKEALLKALGCGLSVSLSDFSIVPHESSYAFIPHTTEFEFLRPEFKHDYLPNHGIHLTSCVLA